MSGALTNCTSGRPVSLFCLMLSGAISWSTPSSALSFASSESTPTTRVPGAESISAFTLPKYGCWICLIAFVS